MRSYYEHLEQLHHHLPETEVKPIFRSSALFPALHTSSISTRYLFLGYWMLKRNISKVSCLITLREQNGQVLLRKTIPIDEAKAYQIELKDLLEEEISSFTGSVEIEFFSATPLVYPYPAVTINYYGKDFSSVVHTAQRVYNDYEDMMTNNKTHVKEAGFNILADSIREPFIVIINGPVAEENFSIDFQFINRLGEFLEYEHIIRQLAPYETYYLYPARETALKEFLNHAPGTVKMQFDLKWVYPRLVVGNVNNSIPAMSLTHSYYDCSQSNETEDFWEKCPDQDCAASLIVPIKHQHDHYTNLTFYPIYSSANFFIDLEIYDEKGNQLLEKKEIYTHHKNSAKYCSLNISDICKDLKKSYLSAKLMAYTKDKNLIPARIKVSLDIGHKHKGLPSNVCTNLIPYSVNSEDEKATFHWMPILADQPNSSNWIMNNVPQNQMETTRISLEFFREKDKKRMKREILINANGHLCIEPQKDQELQDFFNGSIGWVSVSTKNPYISTYYFADNPSGVVGGDHGY